MYKIAEIKNKKIWDDFLDQKGVIFYPFFQSWEWGEVQKSLSFIIYRLGVYKDKKLVGVFQIIDVNARRGHYLHLRHGPVLTPFSQEVFNYADRLPFFQQKR